MNHNELRNKFFDFFKGKEHKIVASSPVIPYDDPSLMFTNAGMNQFKEVLTGNETRSYTKAASSQKCIRVSGKHNDFEIVGFDGKHHTFFEMLGNWSFGDYYKKETIEFAWEFLTRALKFPEDKLAVSIYKDDDESYEIWKDNIKVPEHKIIRLGNIEKGDEENFWSMGDTGPCGFCSEIHYNDTDKGFKKLNTEILENEFIELWNLVFMEFYRHPDGKMTPLENKNVDTGMGLERLYAILHKKKSDYHTDLFMPIIQCLEKTSKKKYQDNEISFQVVADHIRALTFSIADGATFSNEGRGYVLRKILRRASRHLRNLNIAEPTLYLLVDTVIDIMGDFYADIKKKQDNIKKFIKVEEEKFLTTLDNGLDQLNTIINKLKKSKQNTIPGKDVFMLYDTYGFPVDITKEIARENNLEIDENEFNELMQEQKDRGRRSWKTDKELVNIDAVLQKLKTLPATNFKGYDTLELEDTILGIIQNDSIIDKYEGKKDEIIAVLLENTPFYAESGGQVGDQGIISNPDFEFEVIDTQKNANYYLHYSKLNYGTMKKDDKIIAKVNETIRKATMKNHTATHLMQAALRKVIGDHVVQAGSLVSPERLRFDFRHYEAIAHERLNEIEKIVNAVIQRNLPVNKMTKDKEEAIKDGAMAIFGEKYGEKVRVIKVKNYSLELCGGTHVENTGDIGLFLILSEMSIASGIRRIEAVTGDNALQYIQDIRKSQNNLKNTLKASDANLVQKIEQLMERNKELDKKLRSGKFNTVDDRIDEILNSAISKGDSKLILHTCQNEDNEFVNNIGDKLKKNIKSGIILLINTNKEDDKFSILLLFTDDLIRKGNSAKKMINEIAEFFNGSGGGRDDRAQAGGKNVRKINDIVNKSEKLLLKIL